MLTIDDSEAVDRRDGDRTGAGCRNPGRGLPTPHFPSRPSAAIRHCDEYPCRAALLTTPDHAVCGGKYISCFTVHTNSPLRLNIVPLASARDPALLGDDRS